MFNVTASGWLAMWLLLGTFTGAGAREYGRTVPYRPFPCRFVDDRNVDVRLPVTYDQDPHRRYPVLYMHDGQNLFDPETSYGGEPWAVDRVLARLAAEGKIPDCIVVGIWNTPKRFAEYAPAKPFAMMTPEQRQKLRERFGTVSDPLSDAYLRFIVQVLKPFVDSHYRTRKEHSSTFIMGSSMGGLISLYAVLEYPRVFGGAGCLSTHWPLRLTEDDDDFTGVMAAYLEKKLPTRDRPRFWFDYGTETLDAWYERHQQVIDAVMTRKGYGPANWTTRKFPGAAHNEKSWRERLDQVLEFLLGGD